MKTPKTLGKAGKKFWKTVLEEFTLSDAHDLERLQMACSCLDSINAAQGQIEQDGALSQTVMVRSKSILPERCSGRTRLSSAES